MTRAFTFPGQGSQAVGMGRSLYDHYAAAKEVFQEVDEALKDNLSRLMFEGPADDLTLTRNTQPALMTVSVAIMRVLAAGGYPVEKIASHVAGHSLGEYSALCAAGTFSLADTARLLRLRGDAMQRAVPVGVGAMAALLGLDFADARAVAEEATTSDEIVTTANDNAPGQVVISGHKAAVERAIELAKAKGCKRGLLLPVSAPFHCPLMKPAADEMAAALAEVTMNAPVVPVIANVTTLPESDPDRIRELLVEQVTGAVRWRESIAGYRALGIDTVIEAGTGKVLSGMAKRIDPELKTMNIQDPADIDAFVATL